MGKAADGAASNAAAAAAAAEAAGPEAVEVIDLEAESEPPAAVPATGRGAGRQRAPKRKGAAAARAALAAAAAPNGLANGGAAAVHDVGGAAPMEVADGGGDGAAAADSITSANAYLLVYRRTSDAPSQPPPQLPARCMPAAGDVRCHRDAVQYVAVTGRRLWRLLWLHHDGWRSSPIAGAC